MWVEIYKNWIAFAATILQTGFVQFSWHIVSFHKLNMCYLLADRHFLFFLYNLSCVCRMNIKEKGCFLFIVSQQVDETLLLLLN